MLDLRRLRLLAELARHETIAKVADVVGYTPSAVSQALAQLERETGAALLERDGRRVRLTPAARRLVARADRILAEIELAESELAAEHAAVRGELSIGTFPSAAVGLVIPTLRTLRERHPELRCALRQHEPETGLDALRAGALDVLVSERYDDVAPMPSGGLEAVALMSEPLLVVVGADHPAGDPVELATLASEPWIAGDPGTQFDAVLARTCRAAGYAPRIVHRAGEAAVHQQLVAAGLGVGLLPALARRGAPPGLRFVRAVPEPPRRHVGALVRQGARRRPAIVAVLDALIETAATA
ncbi:MAG TPA: LysR substrate-binding domain-containing protein [Solirubrobacter sp.]|nr:LysR substrate-binding domain-containing protein [Solirubrobacter sp.]